MRCEEVRNRLSALLDEEVDPAERPELKRHLERCERCRQELQSLREVRSFLEAERVPPMPSGFHSKVMMAAEQTLESRRSSKWRSPLDLPRWWRAARPGMRVAAVAALALGIGLGALLGSDVSRRAPATPIGPSDTPAGAYGVDYLSEIPRGSLPQVYVAMTSQLDGGGK